MQPVCLLDDLPFSPSQRKAKGSWEMKDLTIGFPSRFPFVAWPSKADIGAIRATFFLQHGGIEWQWHSIYHPNSSPPAFLVSASASFPGSVIAEH
ncbi:hypothetical protein COCNU_06G008430 [Cocos nucifera]|uniref:Uncharacterized protein n=1 Tax=Cocos nucifera TaxID=13894 RepID=A0A8K0IB03_COCNU|nr:hypothetical protein COCNU_06G008430 [Cocos nucifera]